MTATPSQERRQVHPSLTAFAICILALFGTVLIWLGVQGLFAVLSAIDAALN